MKNLAVHCTGEMENNQANGTVLTIAPGSVEWGVLDMYWQRIVLSISLFREKTPSTSSGVWQVRSSTLIESTV
jgi:hypothetical protein